MNNRLEAQRMQKTYGKCIGKICKNCCNYQLVTPEKPMHFCLAYGEEYVTDWENSTKACGLFNRPFYAMKIRVKPLGAQYKKQQDKEQQYEGQISLFGA